MGGTGESVIMSMWDGEPVKKDLGGSDAGSPTILDQFAMAALTGLLSDPNVSPDNYDSSDDFMSSVALCSYEHAQAMMKAREVQK